MANQQIPLKEDDIVHYLRSCWTTNYDRSQNVRFHLLQYE
jgi:hypothetical protein